MAGVFKQLYEKVGNKFVPIQPTGTGGGGSFDPDVFEATVEEAVNTEEAQASVDYKGGVFKFKFGLPQGAQGDVGPTGPAGPMGPQGLPGADGKDGKDGDTPITHKNVMVFKANGTKPDKPVGGSWDVVTNSITYPEGWSHTDELEGIIWMSSGEFNSAYPNQPNWSEPIKISGSDGKPGVDGKADEFIFKLTLTALDSPTTPSTNYLEEGWTDSPSGIDEVNQIEWVSTRKYENGKWGVWSVPAIWSKWGANGQDGDGIEYIYKRNSGEALNNPTPNNTATDEYQGKGDYEGKEYVPSGWTDNPSGVTSTETHEWVCSRKYKNGVWQPFSNPALWARFGQDGLAGQNGISIRTRYAKTNSSSVAPNFVSDNINPGSVWGSIIPNTEGSEAVWMIQAYVTYDNKLASIIDDTGKNIYGWFGPILVTGVPGKSATPINYKTYVYKLSDTKPNPPTSNDPENPGDGWVDYPNTTGQWWQCIGTIDGTTELIIEWSTVLPVNGKDGVAQDGKRVEFRFAVNGSSTSAPSLTNTLRAPSGWTVNPPTKSNSQYMWMIVATINPDDTLYSNWSTPVCISGEKGPQGNTGPAGPTGPQGPAGVSGIPGVEIRNKYCIGKESTYTAIYDSTVAVDLDPVEYGWANTIPTTTKDNPYIWCIQAKIKSVRASSGSNTFNEELETNWSTPFRLSGVNGVDAKGIGISSVDEYYLVSSKSSGITTSSTGWQKNTIPAFTSTNIYLWNYEVINYENGTSASPTTPAIIGTLGKDGRGIKSITEKYLASSKASGVTKDTSGWSDTVPTVDKTKPYLWNWEHILYTDGTVNDFIALIGALGADGADGRAGQIVYPAGVYSKTTSYTATNRKAPYVLDTLDGNYYIMNYIGTWLGTEQNNLSPSQSYAANPNTYWTLMEAFDALYANIGVIANGLIGSAVFNGNWMFSQQGINASGATSNAYENFNPSDPYNASNKFRPNLCFNLATGEAWLGCGKIKFNKDGSGSLANGNITWDKTGKTTIAKGNIQLNADGSCSLANGKVTIDANGNATIGGFVITDSTIGLKDTNFRNGLILGEDGSIDIVTQVADGNGGTQVSSFNFDGQQLTLEQSYIEGANGKTPQMTALVVSSGDTVFRIGNDGIKGKKGTGDWVNLLEAKETTSSNVQIVNQKPATTLSNTLYIVV